MSIRALVMDEGDETGVGELMSVPMKTESLVCKSPIDGTIYLERAAASADEFRTAIWRGRVAQKSWHSTPLAERARVCAAFLDAMDRRKEEVAETLAWQIGRPIKHGPLELRGFRERAEYMVQIAAEALADRRLEGPPGFARQIERAPVGLVLVLAPWNYPYLTAVNSVVPALMAGNSVILKHSTQTMLCAEHFAACLEEAGAPPGVFQSIHCGHELLAEILRQPGIDHVAFTGSVAGGLAVQKALSGSMCGLGLELGGKDPAYVRADADVASSAINLVDGAFFNAGQSCCAVERIYVHADVYDHFLEAYLAEARTLVLGDPRDPTTTLGPVVRETAAMLVRRQIDEAVAQGALALLDAAEFPESTRGGCYLAPQVLVNVTSQMSVMRDESFGPVIGIQKVLGDEEAIRLMNDSEFGLTASVWTKDDDSARRIGAQLETGTVFMNRCDYLDPALAWTGVKFSGRGCTLSTFGYDEFVRPKSYHFKLS